MNTSTLRFGTAPLLCLVALGAALLVGCPTDDSSSGDGDEDAVVIGQDTGDDALDLGFPGDQGEDLPRDRGVEVGADAAGDPDAAGDADSGLDVDVVEVICEPESTRCDGGDVVTCSANGATESRFSCGDEGACEVVEGEAVCQVDCEPNAIGCQGPFTAFLCDESGTVLTPLPCRANQYCDGGGCFPQVCEPSLTSCEDGVVVTCDERGASEVVASCSELPACAESDFGCRCAADGCVPRVCLPGSSTCAGNNVRRCNEDGSGFLPLDSCGVQNCTLGACVPPRCSAGGTYCANELLLECDGGAWIEAADCEESEEICLRDGEDSYCGDSLCEPDSRRCDGHAVLACDARGAAQTRTECGDEELCRDGACRPDPCAVDPETPGCSLECDDEGETEACEGACGEGRRTCTDGIFGACVAGNECVDFDRGCRPVELDVTVDVSDFEVLDAVDVVFLFDRSGSMGEELLSFREQATGIAASLSEVVERPALGLAGFVDAPCSGFGDPGDYGYRVSQALTTSLGGFSSAVGGLTVGGGDDHPESQLEAMYQVLTGEGVTVTTGPCAGVANIAPSDMNWTASRGHLFVWTDASFHRPSDEGYPYPHGVDDVIEAAEGLGVSVSFLRASGFVEPAMEEIATATGGAIYSVAETTNLSRVVVDALPPASAVRSVEVGVEGPGAGFVAAIEPVGIRGLDLWSVSELSFRVTLVADAFVSGEERSLDFDLVFRSGSVELGRHTVEVHIPAAFEDGCANRPPIVRELTLPEVVDAGTAVDVTYVVDEPDGDDVEVSLRVSHGSVDADGPGLRWNTPANPRIATLTVTATDAAGLSDSAEATVVVLGGECAGDAELYELGDHGGTIVATARVSQRLTSAACGEESWGEALFALHVKQPGTWRFVSLSGTPVYLRRGNCLGEIDCTAGDDALDVELDEGGYFLFAEGEEGELVKVGMRFVE